VNHTSDGPASAQRYIPSIRSTNMECCIPRIIGELIRDGQSLKLMRTRETVGRRSVFIKKPEACKPNKTQSPALAFVYVGGRL
jgi:hypothetical protein